MKNPYILFDSLYLLAAAVVYSIAGGCAFYFAGGIWDESILSKVAAILLGYFLFLHFFVLTVAGLRKLCQKPLREGSFPMSLNRDYVAWGVNSICHGLVIASPFASQIFFIFYLNWLYYNLMGMKLPLNSMIGTNAIIRQPELIEIGHRSVIGIGCLLSAHYSPDRKSHCHGKIQVGNNTLIGSNVLLSASVNVGDNSLVGANSKIYPGTTIGNNVKLGPSCVVTVNAYIPDNVIVKANSLITAKMNIKPGETWAGNPAVCIKSSESNPTENSNHG